MISTDPAHKVAQIAHERLLRVNRVGEYISNNILQCIDDKPITEINLEIGCGHGHWLCSIASCHKGELFVGIDLLSKRIRKADRKRELLNLDNVFFLKAEAGEFLEALPRNLHIKNTFIMYPDPWPKKKHHKKRLIQRCFLRMLHDKSHRGSKLFFKTDHEAYLDWTRQAIANSSLWELGTEDWPHDAPSYFEDLFGNSNSCSATYL